MIINALTFFIRFFLLFCNNVLKKSLILLCRVLQLNAKPIKLYKAMKNQNKQLEVVVSTGLQQLLSDIRYLDTETFPTFKSEYKEEIKGMKVIKVYNIVMSSKCSININ